MKSIKAIEKPWYKSKKFWALVTGISSVLAHELLGIPKEDLYQITGLVMTYILGQGVADMGKQHLFTNTYLLEIENVVRYL